MYIQGTESHVGMCAHAGMREGQTRTVTKRRLPETYLGKVNKANMHINSGRTPISRNVFRMHFRLLIYLLPTDVSLLLKRRKNVFYTSTGLVCLYMD